MNRLPSGLQLVSDLYMSWPGTLAFPCRTQLAFDLSLDTCLPAARLWTDLNLCPDSACALCSCKSLSSCWPFDCVLALLLSFYQVSPCVSPWSLSGDHSHLCPSTNSWCCPLLSLCHSVSSHLLSALRGLLDRTRRRSLLSRSISTRYMTGTIKTFWLTWTSPALPLSFNPLEFSHMFRGDQDEGNTRRMTLSQFQNFQHCCWPPNWLTLTPGHEQRPLPIRQESQIFFVA